MTDIEKELFVPLEGVEVQFEDIFTKWVAVHPSTDPPNKVKLINHGLTGFTVKVVFQPDPIEKRGTRNMVDVKGQMFVVPAIYHETPSAVPVAAVIHYRVTGE